MEALRAICEDAVGERRDPLWIVKRDLILAAARALEALPAEDRAVTAPQEPSLRALKLDALIELVANLPRYNCDCLPNGPDGKTRATDEEVQNNSDVYSCNRWVVLATDLESAIGVVHTIRDVEKDEAFLKLAALTHAIEALRGELETLKAIGVIREKD